MSYTLDALAADIHRELSRDPSAAAKEAVCRHVSRALTDPEFLATHLKDKPPGSDPREILYEDPRARLLHLRARLRRPGDRLAARSRLELGDLRAGRPAITEMTDWKIVEKGEAEKPSAGRAGAHLRDASRRRHFYDVGTVHSPRREAPVKLIRIEGKNLDHVKRSNIKAKSQAARRGIDFRSCSRNAEHAALLRRRAERAGRFPRRDIAAPPRRCRHGGRG